MRIETKNEKRFLWIGGPARILLEKGSIEINGAVYEATNTKEIIIHRNRSYTIIVSEEASISIHTTEEGVVREATTEEKESIVEWQETSKKIVSTCKENDCIITVIADVDKGKTTFSTMLANHSIKAGNKTYLVDADVGQSTVGLPGFISMIEYTEPTIWPRFPKPDKMYYIGQITPSGKEHEIIHGINKLLAYTISPSTKIIDTDGWIKGARGIEYKARLIESIRTSHLIMITEKNDHIPIMKKIIPSTTKLTTIKPPPTRKTRSRTERILLRGEKIIRFDNMTQTRILPLTTHYILGHVTLGLGNPLNEEEIREYSRLLSTKVIYGEKLDDETYLVTKGVPRKKVPKTRCYTLYELRNMLVALVSPEGEHVGAGIVIGFNEKQKGIVIRTDYQGRVKGIFTGRIIVDNNTIRMQKE